MDIAGFAAELAAAVPKIQAAIGEVGDATARELVNVMKADASKSRHFKFVGLITSERTKRGPVNHEWVVGPLKSGAGNLAGIAYFGGANGGGRSIRDPQQALDQVQPGFESAMSTLIERVLS